MSRNKHVAVLIPDMTGGGAEQIALRLVEHLLSLGLKVDLVLLNKKGELLELLPEGVRVVDLHAPKIRSAVKPLVRYLKTERPDVLIANMWPITVIGILAHRLAGSRTRVITVDQCHLTRQYGDSRKTLTALRGTMRLFYRFAHARVAVSEGVADDVARLAGLDRSRVSVIYNPAGELPEVPVDSSGLDGLWGIPRGHRILTVGKMKEQKDHELLIGAFARIAPLRPAKLMIVGTGPLQPRLEALAAKLGVADRVLMPGFSTNPWPYYFSADVFALSSRYEGFALVVLEAMYAGLKIVSTDCESGPGELLEGGRYGTLVPVGDEEKLAAALLEALDRKEAPPGLRARVAELSGGATLDRYTEIMFDEAALRSAVQVAA